MVRRWSGLFLIAIAGLAGGPGVSAAAPGGIRGVTDVSRETYPCVFRTSDPFEEALVENTRVTMVGQFHFGGHTVRSLVELGFARWCRRDGSEYWIRGSLRDRKDIGRSRLTGGVIRGLCTVVSHKASTVAGVPPVSVSALSFAFDCTASVIIAGKKSPATGARFVVEAVGPALPMPAIHDPFEPPTTFGEVHYLTGTYSRG